MLFLYIPSALVVYLSQQSCFSHAAIMCPTVFQVFVLLTGLGVLGEQRPYLIYLFISRDKTIPGTEKALASISRINEWIDDRWVGEVTCSGSQSSNPGSALCLS